MTNFSYQPPSGNVTSSVEMFQWVNSVTGSWFFSGSIIAIFIISLVKMLTNPVNTASKSFAAASFVCMIISVMARLMNFVSTGFMSIFIVFTAIGGVWMVMENS